MSTKGRSMRARNQQPERPSTKLRFQWKPLWIVEKYDDEGNFIERLEHEGNIITTAGLERMAGLLVGETVAPLDEEHVRIGIGDGDSAPALTDTGLGTNQYYEVMQSGYPDLSGTTITFRAEFGPSDGNMLWNSFGLDVTDAGGVTAGATPGGLFNRELFFFGEKTGGTWPLTCIVNITQVGG